VIYNNILCLGDSLAFGARTYGCFPLYLAHQLESYVGSLKDKNHCYYRVITKAVSGFTARDLYFKLCNEINEVEDTYLTCLLIGTNDCRCQSDETLFGYYLKQIILALKIKGMKQIYVGSIPPIYNVADPFYPQTVHSFRKTLNKKIEEVVNDFPSVFLVDTSPLEPKHYVDSVHFNEDGNLLVASLFSSAIIKS